MRLIGKRKTCESADERRDLEGVCSLNKSTFSGKTGSAALPVVLTLSKLGDPNFPLGVNDMLRDLDCNLSTYPMRPLWTREESLLSAFRLLIENKTKSFTTQITKPSLACCKLYNLTRTFCLTIAFKVSTSESRILY